ncbi:Structural maintenance of chromosomes protein 2-1 [Vitis vinifera]|uniref:Structural maintenance of chromosomes protein 2-1 n=1 Tax=Vitis vinifera TaxID=29760 RepID=A0A438BRP9_VITVI|nr:Structural maintenance of chromosomes protein 2-1 [Vitis vinifera]
MSFSNCSLFKEILTELSPFCYSVSEVAVIGSLTVTPKVVISSVVASISMGTVIFTGCQGRVDAALDLSHTQNIGRMIKSHFPHSQLADKISCSFYQIFMYPMGFLFVCFLVFQFIVVSLKEGMFNNANVLFRTKFVDGVSTVQRTVAAKQNK